MQRTQQLLASLGPKQAPADLALKLRVAISREAAQGRRPRFEGVLVRLQNAAQCFMFRRRRDWSARCCFSDCCWASLPCPPNCGRAARRSADAVHRTAVGTVAFGTTLGNTDDEAVVVEAHVDANGRIDDYRVLSQPDDAQSVLPQLKNLLIFTTFHPALSMGRPTSGTAVLSFPRSA